jgi:phosphosulfolactate phosphohydrolase-like enzyme
MPTDRTGLLIIRAWIEEGSKEPLRAQVRIVDDVAAGAERTQTLARVEEVVDTVQAWLADLLCGQLPG